MKRADDDRSRNHHKYPHTAALLKKKARSNGAIDILDSIKAHVDSNIDLMSLKLYSAYEKLSSKLTRIEQILAELNKGNVLNIPELEDNSLCSSIKCSEQKSSHENFWDKNSNLPNYQPKSTFNDSNTEGESLLGRYHADADKDLDKAKKEVESETSNEIDTIVSLKDTDFVLTEYGDFLMKIEEIYGFGTFTYEDSKISVFESKEAFVTREWANILQKMVSLKLLKCLKDSNFTLAEPNRMTGNFNLKKLEAAYKVEPRVEFSLKMSFNKFHQKNNVPNCRKYWENWLISLESKGIIEVVRMKPYKNRGISITYKFT